ncbi:MAG: hypothetical protein ABF868_05970 [Sporolactobacillus sp.]
MKILVFIKPFAEQKELESKDIACTNISDSDRAALEIALQYKESKGATVITFAFGGSAADTQLREAFAMGADEAYLLETDSADAVNALTIAAALKKIAADCYVTGHSSDQSELQKITELIGVPLSDFAEGLNTEEKTFYMIPADQVKPRYMQISGIYTAYQREVKSATF